MRVAVDAGVLAELTASIWTSVLGLDVEPVEAVDAVVDGPATTASVQLTGGPEATLAMALPASLCRRVAAVMFGLDVGEVDDDLVRDAVGELANIAGGNLRGRLPGATGLSLPQVVEGEGYRITVPGAVLRCAAAFACGDDVFTVALLSAAPIG